MTRPTVRLLLEDGTVLAEGVAPVTWAEEMQEESDALAEDIADGEAAASEWYSVMWNGAFPPVAFEWPRPKIETARPLRVADFAPIDPVRDDDGRFLDSYGPDHVTALVEARMHAVLQEREATLLHGLVAFLLDAAVPADLYAVCRHGFTTPGDNERCDVCGRRIT